MSLSFFSVSTFLEFRFLSFPTEFFAVHQIASDLRRWNSSFYSYISLRASKPVRMHPSNPSPFEFSYYSFIILTVTHRLKSYCVGDSSTSRWLITNWVSNQVKLDRSDYSIEFWIWNTSLKNEWHFKTHLLIGGTNHLKFRFSGLSLWRPHRWSAFEKTLLYIFVDQSSCIETFV